MLSTFTTKMLFFLLIFIVYIAFIQCEPTCCPDTWVAYNGSCYLFSHQHLMTFVETENYCQQHKAHMVHVGSRLENIFLKDTMMGMKGKRDRWIGLTDETIDSVWRWYDTNDVATFTDWYPGGPEGGTAEDCAVFAFSASYQWDDYPCSNKMQAVFEMRYEYCLNGRPFMPICDDVGWEPGNKLDDDSESRVLAADLSPCPDVSATLNYQS